MTWLRGVGQDLVDKRLWPIALVLVVAIIAAPTVLARTGGGDEVAVPVASAAPDGLRAAVVETAEPGEAPIAGTLRNPFYDPPAPESSANAPEGATTSPAASPTEAGDSAGGSESINASNPSATGDGTPPGADPETATPGSDTSSGAGGAKTKGSGEPGYDLSIRFGVLTDEGKLEAASDLPRLTPLPSAEAPLFVYMGVLSDGKTAVFLLSDGVLGNEGDGTCRPSTTTCETLELRAGQTEFLTTVPDTEGGEPQQWQLDVVSLTRRGTGGKARSASKRRKAKRAAKAGRAEIRRARRRGAADTLDRYRYDAGRGVIRRLSRPDRPKAQAASLTGPQMRRTGTVIASSALLR